MPQMDYPNDDYREERKWFEIPIWLEVLSLVVVCGFFWCVGVLSIPDGWKQLKELFSGQ
jgi:hypothetical protein